MAIHTAQATWHGDIKTGNGFATLGSRGPELPTTLSTRLEGAEGTSPETLIGAAHAECFSMALSKVLAEANYNPGRIETTAKVHLESDPNGGFHIPRIELETGALVPGLEDDFELQQRAEAAARSCVVSKALSAVDISVRARLVS